MWVSRSFKSQTFPPGHGVATAGASRNAPMRMMAAARDSLTTQGAECCSALHRRSSTMVCRRNCPLTLCLKPARHYIIGSLIDGKLHFERMEVCGKRVRDALTVN